MFVWKGEDITSTASMIRSCVRDWVIVRIGLAAKGKPYIRGTEIVQGERGRERPQNKIVVRNRK